MARGKQQQEKKDGQHRKETKEERRARLQAEKEARDVSQKRWARIGSSCHQKRFGSRFGIIFPLKCVFLTLCFLLSVYRHV
jgi:hypothetical protein